VKLLFDQNLSPRLVSRLADLYPDSNHIFLLGLDKATDVEVREHAKTKDFLLVTKDADFSDLCLLYGFPPKVIWIRRGNCTNQTIEELLRKPYDDVTHLNDDQVIGVLTLF
jgi:predicted nuclease of predicted toxin-antitoxin system